MKENKNLPVVYVITYNNYLLNNIHMFSASEYLHVNINATGSGNLVYFKKKSHKLTFQFNN